MRSVSGPRLVTDGLIFYLDAANIRSFRGEPTINDKASLLNNETTPSQNYTLTTFSWVDANDVPSEVWRKRTLSVLLTSGGVNGKQWYWLNQGNYQGKTITFSWYVKSLSGDVTDTICIAEGGYASGNTSTTYTATSTWQRVSVTRTIVTSNSITLGSAQNQVVLDKTILYTGFQLEEKAYVTPLVNGTRGTTVANGGGWADMSGNSNHGELVNGPTYNSSDLGSVVFDGVNDFILTKWGNFNINDYTITCWCKQISNADRQAIFTSYYNGGPSNSQVYVNLLFSYGNFVEAYMNATINGQFRTFSANNYSNNLKSINNFTMTYSYTNNQTIKSYTNGTLQNSSSNPDMILFNNPNPNTNLSLFYYIGSNSMFFKGNIYNIIIYNRALSDSEVLQNYNAKRSRFGL